MADVKAIYQPHDCSGWICSTSLHGGMDGAGVSWWISEPIQRQEVARVLAGVLHLLWQGLELVWRCSHCLGNGLSSPCNQTSSHSLWLAPSCHSKVTVCQAMPPMQGLQWVLGIDLVHDAIHDHETCKTSEKESRGTTCLDPAHQRSSSHSDC